MRTYELDKAKDRMLVVLCALCMFLIFAIQQVAKNEYRKGAIDICQEAMSQQCSPSSLKARFYDEDRGAQ